MIILASLQANSDSLIQTVVFNLLFIFILAIDVAQRSWAVEKLSNRRRSYGTCYLKPPDVLEQNCRHTLTVVVVRLTVPAVHRGRLGWGSLLSLISGTL